MSGKREWDLTSTSSVAAAAEWMRKKAGAQLVLVVRPGDIAFAVDPQIAPTAAREMVELVMPDVQVQLDQARAMARDLAKIKKGF